MSSCPVLAEAILSSGVGCTYPCEDADMLGAEADYAVLEAALQNEVDHYPSYHPGYDEYRYDPGSIEYDSYVLISILTAYYQGTWTRSEVRRTMQMLAVLVAGGAVAYLKFFKKKPDTKGSADLDDYDYGTEDDEEDPEDNEDPDEDLEDE